MYTYGERAVSPNSYEIITSYVTPIRGGAECVGAVLWSDVFAEFTIYLNGVKICGGRTSAASPTLQLDWKACPIGLGPNDVLIVMGEHGWSAPRDLKAVLLVTLL